MKAPNLELTLSWIAAIGGSIAGLGGFLIAYHQMTLDAIERSPAISLSCRPEFRLAELAQNIRPPDDTLLLNEKGGQWVHVGGAAAKAGAGPAPPEPFARCAVGNYGRFPALNIRLPLHLSFTAASGAVSTANAVADIPGLAAGANYEFSMLNGSAKSVTFHYDPNVTVTRVDTHVTDTAPLYTDTRVAALEKDTYYGTIASGSIAPGTFVLQHFAFKPAIVHVRAGGTISFVNRDNEAHEVMSDDEDGLDSGAIDPHTVWRRAFAKAGRYTLYCGYHTYMKATVVVE